MRLISRRLLLWMTSLALGLSPARAVEEKLDGLMQVQKSIREKKAAAKSIQQRSHEALDRADYEATIREHKRSKALEEEAAELEREALRKIESILASVLQSLGSDDYATRERASLVLLKFGGQAIPILKKAALAAEPEVRTRLDRVVHVLQDMKEDDQGFLHQWASGAKASSQYSTPDYSASQATGKPDTHAAGDTLTAWASLEPDAGVEWLELTYAHRIHPAVIRIRETFNPGAVVKVEAKDLQGQWHTLWEGKDATKECPGWMEVRCAAPAWTTNEVRISLDTRTTPGWNEIDAVELLGTLDPQALDP